MVDRTRTFDSPHPPGTITVPTDADGKRLPPSPAGYELVRELGSGGMGMVYLARELATERLVAMKFLQRPGNHAAFERFLVEVRALALVDHPCIIRVHSSDFLRADPYFTAEYVPGGSLARKVEADGPLEPLAAARLVANAARAVHAANLAHVIHRDLKPSNILLAADGSPRIADFGLAKRLDRDDQLTTASGPLGTPRYMAPEQTGREDGTIDARTDVYGLGATLYHLITAQPPFTGTAEESIRQILHEPPTPPREIRKEIPPALEAIALKCLEKDPARRYASAEALAVDLDRFIAGESPTARLLTWRRRMGQRIWKHRTAVAAIGVALVVVLAAGAILWPTKPADPRDEMRKALQAGRSYTLIGATGLPRWHDWAYGPTALAEASTGDESCAFESIGDALLVLADDPGVDRYAVMADLRMVRSNASRVQGQTPPGERELPGSSKVGLFLGYSRAVASNGLAVPNFMRVSFNDYLIPETRKKGVQQAMVQLGFGFIGTRPDARDDSVTGGVSTPIRFAPADGLPAKWRRIRIEVSPDGVKTFWAEKPDGPLTPLAELSPAGMVLGTKTERDDFAAAHPGAMLQLPPWSPRMPLGIWCRGAAVSIRNVVIEPLP